MLSDIYAVSNVGVAARYAAQLRELLAHNQAQRNPERFVQAASRESQGEIQTSRQGAIIDLRA